MCSPCIAILGLHQGRRPRAVWICAGRQPCADFVYLVVYRSSTSVERSTSYGTTYLDEFNNRGEFRQYAYGSTALNLQLYEQPQLPFYDISTVSKCIHLHTYDFQWSSNINEALNGSIIRIMKDFDKS